MSVLQNAISAVVFGQSKVGKSTAVARAFSDYLWITTNPNVFAPYVDWCARNPADVEKLRLNPEPKIGLALEEYDWSAPLDAEGRAKRNDVRKQVISFMQQWVGACRSGKAQSKGIVFDEFSTYASWVWPLFLQGAGGKAFTFPAQDAMADHFRWLASVPHAAGRDMICVAHSALPTYESKDGAPNYGKLKHCGGPSFGFGRLTTLICQAFDVVVELAYKESFGGASSERIFLTQGNPEMYRGVRRFAVQPQEDLTFLSRLRSELDVARSAKVN